VSDTTMMTKVAKARLIKKQHCKLKEVNGISTKSAPGSV
jgi:hypothetical protein